MMLTEKKILTILDIGDDIFVLKNDQVFAEQVTGIEKNGIETTEDFYGYDDHREMWFLSEKGAKDTLPIKEDISND